MSNNQTLRQAIHFVLAASVTTAAITVSPKASAQEKPSPVEAAKLETVVVTGTRIAQPALEAVSPVMTVNTEEFKQTGTTRVEDLLNSLPQVASDLGTNQSNGATGTATVSLRGLGANRTLVLVNGRRLMPGDPTQNGNASPDLNQIPAALVDRVDVLTGGASSVYGADAVAGVVNFVMNDHFEGVRLDGTYGVYQHENNNKLVQDTLAAQGYAVPSGTVWDGNTQDYTIVIGGNFADGKGNATAYAGYRKQKPVLQGSRDFSACSLSTSSGVLSCAGSSTSYPGRFNYQGTSYEIGPNNTLIPFQTRYNFAPLNYFQRPDERYTAGVFAHYDVNDHAKAYMEFMFMDDRSISQVAPSGAFYGTGLAVGATGLPNGRVSVNCDNPFLTASELSVFCGGNPAAGDFQMLLGRRNVEGGPRIDDLGHTSFRTVVGLKGDISEGWSYDAYFLNGISRLSEEFLNDVSRSHLANALTAVREPNGSIVCRLNAGGANNAPGCVPYNIFQLGGVTPDQVAYFSIPGLSKGSTTERIFSASVTGDFGKNGVILPTAKTGLGINIGTEYREEKSELNPDYAYISGDLAGQGGPVLPTVGSFHVWEGFIEARLPILEDVPFAKSLTVEAGYRYSSYTLEFGSTNTYKFGVQWAPIDDVRLRGMYQRAVRAPNIQELFLQPRVQLDGVTDPCSGATPTATLAQCASSGVTPAQYGHIDSNPAFQYNGLVSGNKHLVPETADTYTFGLVFTPTFLNGFTSTIDYYDIRIKNYINQYGADLVLSTCLNTGDPFFCNKVHRDADGSIWQSTSGYIEDGTYNTGTQHAQGIDLAVQYLLGMGGLGHLNFDLAGTYNMKFETELTPNIGKYDCAGYYGATCGVPSPEWRHRLRMTWRTPLEGFDTWIAWRYIGSVKADAVNPSPVLASSTLNPGTDVPSFSYIDLGAAYTYEGKYTFRLGINNVTDKDPPIINTGYLPTVLGNGNTIPQTWDTLGRFIFANVTLDF